MKINSALTTKLAEYHLLVGYGFFGFSTFLKDAFPHSVALQPIVQLPCAFLSSVLIPMGSFLALSGLILGGERRRKLLCFHLLGLVFAMAILSCYFYSFLVMNRVLDLPNALPSILPKLVENARSFPDEQKRILEAQWAYRLYGVVVAYPHNDLNVSYYVPTQEDKIFWRKEQTVHTQSRTVVAFLKKMIDQWPYLFGLYLATFTATYVTGGIWLLLKIPKDTTTAS